MRWHILGDRNRKNGSSASLYHKGEIEDKTDFGFDLSLFLCTCFDRASLLFQAHWSHPPAKCLKCTHAYTQTHKTPIVFRGSVLQHTPKCFWTSQGKCFCSLNCLASSVEVERAQNKNVGLARLYRPHLVYAPLDGFKLWEWEVRRRSEGRRVKSVEKWLSRPNLSFLCSAHSPLLDAYSRWSFTSLLKLPSHCSKIDCVSVLRRYDCLFPPWFCPSCGFLPVYGFWGILLHTRIHHILMRFCQYNPTSLVLEACYWAKCGPFVWQ